jgi:two-component system, chemotaxis family, CheB/CheR fusion protein
MKVIMGKAQKSPRRTLNAGHAPGAAVDAPDRNHESATGTQDYGSSVAEDFEEEDLPALTFFPIVAAGASAGGLEAFTGLLQHLPVDTGMAFVFIQHLAPQHTSMLSTLLSRATAMPVMEIQHGMLVKPDHVYIIPPNTLMRIEGGVLKLAPRPEERGAPRPIDYFLHSLAADRKAAAIGVILSGADADGALGLRAIRDEGGIAIVQSESSAKYPDMPRAALAAGAVDLILSPEEIGDALARIGKQPSLMGREPQGVAVKNHTDENQWTWIFALLRNATGVDFRGYKRRTIQRRINRRMVLQQHQGLEAYRSELESNRSELLALYEDVLINVTGFFRDPEAFRALEKKILPRLLHERESGMPLRVWVPGCSTGEEAYSLAMCLVEAIPASSASVPIQIFGTDISERSISIARTATYAENQVAKLSPERQSRFFKRVENGYQIIKPIREMCVFARQNLMVDPPFSRLDLVSCRNVLIYLDPDLQSKAITTFHFALRPEGYLILGHSESLQHFPDLFSRADNQHKFYIRKSDRPHVSIEMIRTGFANEQPGNLALSPAFRQKTALDVELEKAAERLVLSEYGPAWVIVNESFDIIHSRGDTSLYLQLAPGRATLALLKMAREGIRGELRKLLAKAKSEEGLVQSAVFQERAGGEARSIRLEVRRIAGSAGQGGRFLVLFFGPANDRKAPPAQSRSTRTRSESKAEAVDVERLKQELLLTSQRMQSIIDERDSANQDLTSANEEIQSSNEELQSINEELETSKEELQSSNEELNTLNGELQNRNRELRRLGDDLTNFLSSTTIPILMLDHELRIRRMTSAAEQRFNIRSSDIGRPIGDIRMQLNVDDLELLVRRVMETLNAEELELQDLERRWHLLRVRPYRTADNRIEGAVLTLIDIDQIRQTQIKADAARDFAESVVESVQTPLLVLRGDLRIRIANRAFCESYGLQHAEIENRFFHEIGGGRWNLPELRIALERLPSNQKPVEDLEIEQEYPGLGKRNLLISARSVQPGGENQILVAVEDVTAQKRAEQVLIDEQERLKRSLEFGKTALHESESALLLGRNELRALTAKLLQTQAEERRRVSRELHDDLSQKTAKLQFDVETLEQHLPPDLKEVKKRLLNIRDGVETLSNDIRRIAYELHPSSLDHLGVTVALRTYVREFTEREGIPIRFTSRRVPAKIPLEITSTLYRIVQEALRNVSKHAGKTSVSIALTGGSNQLSLSIQDHGIGFDVHSLQDKGGLGLISMQERARLVRGDFSLETLPGHGATITVHVPLSSRGA